MYDNGVDPDQAGGIDPTEIFKSFFGGGDGGLGGIFGGMGGMGGQSGFGGGNGSNIKFSFGGSPF